MPRASWHRKTRPRSRTSFATGPTARPAENKMPQAMDDDGLEHAAILLMSLGEEDAARVFQELKEQPKLVQRLGETISKMKAISRDRVESVLDKFGTAAADASLLVSDTDEYVKAVLRKALGEEKAALLIDRIL